MHPREAKRKGRETENLFVEYLIDEGVPYAERRRLNGSTDQGDVTGWPGVCVEVKSGATLNPQGWLRELATEMVNSHADTGFVAVRLKGKPDPQDWVAMLPMPVLMDLMRAAGWIKT
jgi:hypothetical protein